MLPYRSSGRIAPSDVAWLILAALIGALVAGGLANMIGQYFRIVVPFAVALGVIVGVVGSAMIHWRRFQTPAIAAIIGVLGGLAAFSADQVFDYLRDRHAITQEMVRVVDRLGGDVKAVRSHGNLSATIDLLMVRAGRGDKINLINSLSMLGDEPLAGNARVGSVAALRGWLALRHRSGVSILIGGQRERPGPPGGLLIWAISALLSGGIAGVLFFKAAREPVCSGCGDWFEGSSSGLPAANYGFRDHVRQALEQHDANELARMFPARGLHRKHLAINFRPCKNCTEALVYTELQRVRRYSAKRSSTSPLLRGLLPPAAAQEIAVALKTARRRQREEAIRKIVRPKNQHRR